MLLAKVIKKKKICCFHEDLNPSSCSWNDPVHIMTQQWTCTQFGTAIVPANLVLPFANEPAWFHFMNQLSLSRGKQVNSAHTHVIFPPKSSVNIPRFYRWQHWRTHSHSRTQKVLQEFPFVSREGWAVVSDEFVAVDEVLSVGAWRL